MNNTKIVLDNFLESLMKRDLEKLVNLFSDDIEWHIPGNTTDLKWLGDRNSKKGVKNCFRLLWTETEPISAEVHKIFMDKSEVVISGSFVTRMLKTDKVVSSIFFIHVTVKHGKIVKYKLLEDSYAVSKAFLK